LRILRRSTATNNQDNESVGQSTWVKVLAILRPIRPVQIEDQEQ
jgi:hypothetical protein